MFKIALTAGHYLGTAGKRCMKSLDPNETREWFLNDRVADKVEKLLQNYTGYELLRTDDTTGKKDIPLRSRTNAANNWKADFYLSIHHNAGVKGGKGGGITAHVYTKPDAVSVEWQKALYNALIEATGLKGNRASPLVKQNLHECRETKMPSVLLELGFMDSQVDVPIILSEAYADKCAEAIVKVLAERGKLTRKDTVKEIDLRVTVLKKGAKGEQVKALQALLIGYGFDCGKSGIDGSFGSATDTAVKKYQTWNGLEADGSVGSATWHKLLGAK